MIALVEEISLHVRHIKDVDDRVTLFEISADAHDGLLSGEVTGQRHNEISQLSPESRLVQETTGPISNRGETLLGKCAPRNQLDTNDNLAKPFGFSSYGCGFLPHDFEKLPVGLNATVAESFSACRSSGKGTSASSLCLPVRELPDAG